MRILFHSASFFPYTFTRCAQQITQRPSSPILPNIRVFLQARGLDRKLVHLPPWKVVYSVVGSGRDVVNICTEVQNVNCCKSLRDNHLAKILIFLLPIFLPILLHLEPTPDSEQLPPPLGLRGPANDQGPGIPFAR